MTGPFAVKFYGSNFDCGVESGWKNCCCWVFFKKNVIRLGSIVEYVPSNVMHIIEDLLPIIIESEAKKCKTKRKKVDLNNFSSSSSSLVIPCFTLKLAVQMIEVSFERTIFFKQLFLC